MAAISQTGHIDTDEAATWNRVDKAFKKLKQLLEVSHLEESSTSDRDDEDEGVLRPASARALALPIVKLFAFGTHLLRISHLLQPLACVAFGSIDKAVYIDIFWEAVVEAEDAQIRVYDVHESSNKVVFELSIEGFEFRVLYHQCSNLLQSCPDIVSTPNDFLKDRANDCLHVSDLIQTLKTDQQRLKHSDINLTRESFDGAHEYAIWPTRLQLASATPDFNSETTKSLDMYEGFYVIGYNQSAFILNAVNKAIERAAKDKATVSDSCFLNMKSIPFSEFTDTFSVCQQTWPRKSPPNPLDDESKLSTFSRKHKTKKVHKDGRKVDKQSTLINISTSTDNQDTLPSLRPASHVLTRLRHDSKLDIDEYAVGYEDRHTDMIQEKVAAAWQRDTTHEEFIPEHRIQYFKRVRLGKGELVWDRRKRLDKMFGGSRSLEE